MPPEASRHTCQNIERRIYSRYNNFSAHIYGLKYSAVNCLDYHRTKRASGWRSEEHIQRCSSHNADNDRI